MPSEINKGNEKRTLMLIIFRNKAAEVSYYSRQEALQ
jgi:hypothetical protein